ncbi:hypothetical protein BpHYR1_025929 [Brachionus plicatilis]|uniref:RNA-directed DNA polymerase from mobile element jockey-like n=1 Tax=Brachionus plicatilis TaxID=10195 RepID=A0A3M7SM36_BRAPC|nr:hypothetical protein BpHYR1_025929 [Brachionus plicatilis]
MQSKPTITVPQITQSKVVSYADATQAETQNIQKPQAPTTPASRKRPTNDVNHSDSNKNKIQKKIDSSTTRLDSSSVPTTATNNETNRQKSLKNLNSYKPGKPNIDIEDDTLGYNVAGPKRKTNKKISTTTYKKNAGIGDKSGLNACVRKIEVNLGRIDNGEKNENVKKYVESIICEGETLTDQDIIEIVQKTIKSCDDDVEVIDQEPVSVSNKQAKQAIDQVQFFFETSKDFNECDLELLSKIKERMSELSIFDKEIINQKDSWPKGSVVNKYRRPYAERQTNAEKNEQNRSQTFTTPNNPTNLANTSYARVLVKNSTICYLNDLWTGPNENNLIKNLNSNRHTKNEPLYQSAMGICKSIGRPFGGQSWLLDDSCEILDYEFFSRHLSYVYLKVHGNEIICVRVHLPFDDPKRRAHCKSIYELSLSRVFMYIKRFEDKRVPIILEFNADPYRGNRFDKFFNDMIKNLDLILISSLNLQSCRYTYEGYSSHNSNLVKDVQCNIIDSIVNMSDHKAVMIDFMVNSKSTHMKVSGRDKVVSNCESFINAQKENIKCKQDHINKFMRPYAKLCKMHETFSLDSEKRLIKSEVEETLNGFKPGDFIPEFDLDTLERVISESINSTVKGCHMTSVLNALQLFNFDQLYVFSKLSFISTTKFNRMASVIYQDLCLNKPTMENKLKSFNQDIVLFESHFTSEMSLINSNVEAFKKDLKLQFKQENGLTDSVKLCLKNINDNKYFTLLINLTKSFGSSSGTNIGD